MRLIDADALIEQLNDLYEWCQDERKSGLEQSMCIVQEQPTIHNVDRLVDCDKCIQEYCEMCIHNPSMADCYEVRRGGNK